jgi:hypothetical protein
MAKKRNHPKSGNVDRVHKPLSSHQKPYHSSIHAMSKNTFAPSVEVSKIIYSGSQQFIRDLHPEIARNPLKFLIETERWIAKSNNGHYASHCIPFLATAWGLASVHRGDPDSNPEGSFVLAAPAVQRSERAA